MKPWETFYLLEIFKPLLPTLLNTRSYFKLLRTVHLDYRKGIENVFSINESLTATRFDQSVLVPSPGMAADK